MRSDAERTVITSGVDVKIESIGAAAVLGGVAGTDYVAVAQIDRDTSVLYGEAAIAP